MSQIELERRATATGEDISKLRRPTAAHIDPPPPVSLAQNVPEAEEPTPPGPVPSAQSGSGETSSAAASTLDDVASLREALRRAEEGKAALALKVEGMQHAAASGEGGRSLLEEIETQWEFSKRMKEALMARDKRLIQLEQLVMEQTGLKIRAEEDRM